ncbi:unnamed protein product [Oikopleura dioica]|uniref:Uncharacterized protein n=1 Tax=Oikopleura dioica TaxID=34765 RepID=E4XZB0_OIKDI|nr:unnamed protein product [Oikopleura dioica]
MHSGSNDGGDHCIIAYSYDSKIMILRVIGDDFFEEDSHDFDPSRAKRPISTYSSSSISSSAPLKVEHLRFIGTQLMGVSERSENIAFWNTARRGKWQQQKLEDTILSLESVSTFVYMGCDSGRIHFTDLEKFPLRTKDNSLLVTELYTDPMKEPITALAVSYDRNPAQEKHYDWETLELCYGTRDGTVRVVVQSPGFNKFGLRSLQLLQTYKVHCCPVTSVSLSGRFLISVCASNHVRTWAMTRFRGTLSTQPGSAPFANFSLTTSQPSLPSTLKCGPYGDAGNSDETQIFCQLPMQLSDTLLVRAADKGARIGTLMSVNGSPITTFSSHDFESLPRMGLKPFRLVMTGHLDGSVQVWDLTKPLEQYQIPQNIHSSTTTQHGGDVTTQELIEIAQKADEAKIALLSHSS